MHHFHAFFNFSNNLLTFHLTKLEAQESLLNTRNLSIFLYLQNSCIDSYILFLHININLLALYTKTCIEFFAVTYNWTANWKLWFLLACADICWQKIIVDWETTTNIAMWLNKYQEVPLQYVWLTTYLHSRAQKNAVA